MKEPLLHYYGCLRGDSARAMVRRLTQEHTQHGPAFRKIDAGPLKGCYAAIRSERGHAFTYKIGRGRGYVLLFKPVIRVSLDNKDNT